MPSTTAAIKRAYSDLPLQKLFDYTAEKASFLCTCALRSKIKCSQCTWDSTVQFSQRQQNEGADWRTPRLGHGHHCWTSTLVLSGVWSPIPTGLIPSKWALVQLVSNCGDSPENGNGTFKNRQKKSDGKTPLPLSPTCCHKRKQSAVPSPTLATTNKQNSWPLLEIYPAVKLVLLNYGNYFLMTIFRLLVRSVL